MAVIALVAVGLLGDGFMLYVLLHWMHDDARNRHQIGRVARKGPVCARTLGHFQNAERWIVLVEGNSDKS